MIHTSNLYLIPANKELLEAALKEDGTLAALLDVSVPPNWSEFGAPAFQYALDRIAADPESEGWWSYFPIHKQDNQLIGSGGYKGRAREDGEVEIGYEIALSYRGKGLATEMARALVDHAFSFPEIKLVSAHTLAETNASTRILEKCGFVRVKEIIDPEDGHIWRWERQR